MRTLTIVCASLLVAGSAHAEVTIDFGPSTKNPTIFHTTLQAAAAPKTLGVPFESDCGTGFTTEQPLARVRIGAARSLRIRAPQRNPTTYGPAMRLLVFTSDGQHLWCSSEREYESNQSIYRPDWDPGEYLVRIVYKPGSSAPRQPPPPTPVDIYFEDPGRAETFRADIPVETIDKLPTEAKVLRGKLQAKRRPVDKETRCTALFPDQPDVIVDVTRPMQVVRFDLLPTWPRLEVRIRGPLPDGKLLDAPGTCDPGGRHVWIQREGRYGLYVGGDAAQGAGEWAIAMTSDAVELAGRPSDKIPANAVVGKRDPAATSPLPIPADMPVAARDASRYFYQLHADDLEAMTPAAEALRTKIFTSAPRTLWVYPKLDLDAQIARPLHAGKEDRAQDAFPRKDEPLLIYRAERDSPWVSVLAVDGSFGEVQSKYLVGQPSGEPAWPSAPRGGDVSIAEARAYSTPEDQADLKKQAAEWQKYQKCRDSLMQKAAHNTLGNKYDRAVHELKGDTYSATMGELGHLSEQKCHPNLSALNTMDDELRRRLNQRRTARRARSLPQWIAAAGKSQ